MSFEDKFYSQHKSLSFNDVLIQPTDISNVCSRNDVKLKTRISKNILCDAPIIASPMDKVANLNIALELAKFGCVTCFHRFQSVEAQVKEVKEFKRLISDVPILGAISARLESNEEQLRIEELIAVGVDGLILDTAMGTNVKVLESLEKIKKKYQIDIIAGNVVNEEGCRRLINAGADGIRLGIGNGSACLTRLQTGCGRGQLTALIECADICKENNVALISDGGMYSPGDFAKAIAAGANCVIMGSPLAGHIESPGEVFYKYRGHLFPIDAKVFVEGIGLRDVKDIEGLEKYKQYRGMASKELQTDFYGGVKTGTTHEGLQRYIKLKGNVKEAIIDYLGGLKSAMSYCNSLTIEEFHKNAKFEKLSTGSQKESYER